MTSTSTTISSPASGTSSNRTGRGSRSRRPQLSPAQREAADAARAAKIAALHERIGEQVEQLTADPQWRAMLDAAAKFHTYSLNNQLLIELQAAGRGINPTRVAGFTTWKALGRSVLKGSTGLAVLAPCTYTPKDTPADTGTGQDTRRAAPAATTAAGIAGEPAGGDADQSARGRVLRGFRVAHVFDISQTDGDPLPDVRPELLTGDAPAALWDALAAQVATHGYTLTREHCGQANGLTDPAARTVRVRPDIADAQAVKTLAHELAHIECGHTADGYDYRGCRGRAEAEAESVAYIVTAWAGLDAGAYTVPYVAAWSAGDTDVVRAAAATVTAAARRILDHLDRAEATETPPGDGHSASPAGPVAQPGGARVLATG
ncbi:ArdC-like ssDNA-binding domain-containing protein [Blastococcus capsensis]|uniref:ArdC-like ssDNA-binding domain-containing protein n=1 Tax=Blastococcus capsensis TaxID=1564163 RepID=UPI002540FB13|nr:ArdC-like ssDNA-binding domain-containing protein [Blastococcus capsensis]MDK3258946.1 ArdC-like ssDNA-binding domain-containing protein [Blastococcus capsensis]